MVVMAVMGRRELLAIGMELIWKEIAAGCCWDVRCVAVSSSSTGAHSDTMDLAFNLESNFTVVVYSLAG